MADVGTEGLPVYRFVRNVDRYSRIEDRLDAAIGAYLQGPSGAEREAGYMTAIGTPNPQILLGVTVENGLATIEFDSGLEDNSFGTQAGQVFIAELSATAFQFGEVDQLNLTIAGDCDRFWRLLESACQLVPRTS